MKPTTKIPENPTLPTNIVLALSLEYFQFIQETSKRMCNLAFTTSIFMKVPVFYEKILRYLGLAVIQIRELS